MAGKLPPIPAGLAALRAQAEALASRHKFDEAIACFQLIVDSAPNDAWALLQISYMHSLAGRYREARRYALQAFAAQPRDPAVVAELVARLRTFNEPQAVLQSIQRLGPLGKISIPVLLQLAQRVSFLNLQSEALRFLDEARRGDPDFPPTIAARGQVLTYLGRLDEAQRELQRCTARAPALAQPHWLLSRIRTWTAQENHIAVLRKELARPGRTPDDLVLLQYALHKELDDCGDTEGAWEALAQACRIKRGTLRYEALDSVRLVDDLVAQRLPPAAAVGKEPGGLVPVFIVGMHRSGTTLLEQLLAGHHDVQDMGELYDFTVAMRWATDHHCRGVVDREVVRRAPGVDHAEIGARYLAGVAWRANGRRFVIDKLPSNFLNLGSLLTALPQARVLHMVRDPMETCFSNLRELFSDANPYSYDQIELADYFGQYRRLMAHWHARFPGRIHDVHYDRLVADPDAELRAVAAYCGLEFEPAMLQPSNRPVATASAVQVRGGVRKQGAAKWRPYAAQLAPLAARLRSLGIADAPSL